MADEDKSSVKIKTPKVKPITDPDQKHYLKILKEGILRTRQLCFYLQHKYPKDKEIEMMVAELDHIHNIVGDVLLRGDTKYFEEVEHPVYLKQLKVNHKKGKKV